MYYLGDFFALGLVLALIMFYFESKTSARYMPLTSRFYVASLILTAVSAVLDILSCRMLEWANVSLWMNMTVNTLCFVMFILTTTTIGLFMFHKILEHTHELHCLKRAYIGMGILFAVYMVFVIGNFWNSWLFYFDAQGGYHRGPLNGIGYFVTLCQMTLVVICYLHNSKSVSRPMRNALVQTFPVVVVCFFIQRLYPAVMLNCYIMSMVEAVLFLNFQGQRQGVHALTELNDRHRFFREMEGWISRGLQFQVFLINIKNYGVINQKYGHRFGDELLCQVAFSLDKLFPRGQAFHMNGTVFAVLLPYQGQAVAERWSNTLLGFLEQGIDCQNHHVSLDFVMVDYPMDTRETDAGELYEKLEYAATRAFRDKIHYIRYVPEMSVKMQRTRYLHERLKQIDAEHGYEVWYQPTRCLATGRFCSMEALVRLREPDGTLISPGEFIPIAEESGYIAPITWFVVESTCLFLKNNPELENVCVSINVPMQQILEAGFITRLNSIVDQAGIAHHRICLEFTERTVLDSFQQTLEIMTWLRQQGYRFFLDDFGTGYSNFNAMLQLPFESIKLDSSLVHPHWDEKDPHLMVRTLTKLFHDMSLTVVAEGVETMEEAFVLTEIGVDRLQGFALARPMPEEKILNFYREHTV